MCPDSASKTKTNKMLKVNRMNSTATWDVNFCFLPRQESLLNETGSTNGTTPSISIT